MQQLRLAFRTLSKTPFVTGIAIVSLALGIGANSAIYSVFNQMLVRPLPVNDPGALVNLSAPGEKNGSLSCGLAGECDDVFSHPMFRDLEKSQKTFTGIAAHASFGANISLNGNSFDGSGHMVSGSYFPVLGLKPAIGRLLSPDDDAAPGANAVVVLSYGFWRAQLGGDPNVLNQRITINGKSWTVVGVAPDQFNGTTIGAQPKVFVPISMRSVVNSNLRDLDNRKSYWAYLFARLKPGVTVKQAEVAINSVYRPIIRDIEAPAQQNISEASRKKFAENAIVVAPGAQGQSTLRARAERPLYMLLGVSAMVVLIACANIANLLLARGANRAMEMSVRLALGASRRQLLSQLLTESLLLAIVGGISSLLVAKWTLSGIAAMLPASTANALHLNLEPTVILFAGALSIGTGLLFGMFPALHSTRSDLVTSIRANAGQISGARRAARFRTSLVTIQIALSMALLTSAGLFLKSLTNVNNVKLGSNIENVVTFSIAPQRSGYNSERSKVLFQRIEEDLRGIPGVTAVSSSLIGLLSGNSGFSDVQVQGFSKEPDVDRSTNYNVVGAGFFDALGMRMVSGREFAASDVLNGARVAVVNETFAKKFKLGADAVGTFMANNATSDSLNIQIVGVVQDAKYADAKEDASPMFFTPWMQDPNSGSMNFYVRTTLPMDQIVQAIPGVMKQIDATVSARIRTMPQQLRDSVYIDLMISKLSALFAMLATLLAAVGLYGVLAYTVAQRTREIGVRMALGADSLRVKGMVLRQVGGMLAIGGVVGLVAAFGLGRAASSLLYGIQGNDPVVFVSSLGLLLLVALLAGYLPARRASRVHPMQALRYE